MKIEYDDTIETINDMVQSDRQFMVAGDIQLTITEGWDHSFIIHINLFTLTSQWHDRKQNHFFFLENYCFLS